MSQPSTPPMFVRSREPGTTTPSRSFGDGAKTTLPADAYPDVLVGKILSLMSEERFQSARRLALEAADCFPDHRKLGIARKIFDHRQKATRLPGNEPDRTEEFAWLNHPPDSVRGKWVVLVGSEMIGASADLEELADSIRSMNLPKAALVHYFN